MSAIYFQMIQQNEFILKEKKQLWENVIKNQSERLV